MPAPFQEHPFVPGVSRRSRDLVRPASIKLTIWMVERSLKALLTE